MGDTIRIISEKYENEKTGEIIDGITTMVDGKLRQVLDVLIQKEDKYNSYPEIMRDILFSGISDFMNKHKA